MKPRVKPQDSRVEGKRRSVEELFRSKLKNMINLRHELVRLGQSIDWARLEAHFAPHWRATPTSRAVEIDLHAQYKISKD